MISGYLTRKPKVYKQVESDPQAHLVYQMERELIGQCIHTSSTYAHMTDIIEHACRKYRTKFPNLILTESSKREFGHCTWTAIVLNPAFHGDNVAVLIHELAHWIAGEKGHDSKAVHGPEFVGWYGRLLEDYRMMPLDCFFVLCDRYGVKYK